MSDMDKQFHECSSSMLYLSDAPETEESLVTPKAGDVAGRPGLTPVIGTWMIKHKTKFSEAVPCTEQPTHADGVAVAQRENEERKLQRTSVL